MACVPCIQDEASPFYYSGILFLAFYSEATRTFVSSPVSDILFIYYLQHCSEIGVTQRHCYGMFPSSNQPFAHIHECDDLFEEVLPVSIVNMLQFYVNPHKTIAYMRLHTYVTCRLHFVKNIMVPASVAGSVVK